MIARVKCGFQSLRVLGIARDPVKINDCVEVSWRANPCIDSFAICLRCRARMVISRADERQNRCPKYLDAVRVSAHNHLLVRRGDVTNQCIVLRSWNIVLARQCPDIVDAFEHDQIASGGLGEHVMIETCQRIGSEAIEQNTIPADPMIQDSNLSRRGTPLQTLSEHIRPAIVCIRGCAMAVCNRIS